MEVDKYISTLLYDYDCVIVPQLGGFVTNYRPADFDEKLGNALPPAKDIRFNKNLTKSDGLLQRIISEEVNLTFEKAGQEIKAEVEAYWSKLNGGEKLKLKKIGLLYIDEHKNLRFEPFEEVNYLRSAFGFEAFRLPPMEKKAELQIEHEKTMAPAIPDIKEKEIRSGHSRSMYWVAAATLLPFITMSLYLGISTDFKSPKDLSFAELVPFSKSKRISSEYSERQSDGAPSSYDAPDYLRKAIAGDKYTAPFPYSFETGEMDSSGVWIDLTEKSKVVSVTTSEKDGIYHIIAGCFGEEGNAIKFVKRLQKKGFDASILDYHKKLHRVKMESFSDYQTALSELIAMRTEGSFPNAWLLKKTNILRTMAKDTRDLGTCSLTLDGDGIIELHIYHDETLEPDKIHEIFDVIHQDFPQARALMVTAGKKAALSPEARELVSHGNITEQIKADAIVTEHYSHQMAANFFVRYNQPERPTKLFKTEDEAMEWLKGFLEKK